MQGNAKSLRALPAAAWMAAAFALLFLVGFGVLGKGRGGSEAFADVKFWYASTDMWNEGRNPYDLAAFSAHNASLGISTDAAYAYPPTAYWLGLALQGHPYLTAKYIWVFLNFLALAALLLAAHRFLRTLPPNQSTSLDGRLALPLVAILLLLSPFTANVIWAGQTTLVVAAMLAWAWLLIYDLQRPLLGGVLLALGAVKPQIALLLGIWLLLDRRWLPLVSAAGTSLVLMAIPLKVSGLELISQWLGSTRQYMTEPSQSLLLSHNLDLGSVAIGLGAPKGTILSAAVLLAGATAFFVFRRQLKSSVADATVAFSLLIPLSLLTFFGRDYDLAACAGLLVVSIHLGLAKPARLIVLMPMLAALYCPHRLVERLNVPILTYWRPCLLAVFLVVVLAWYVRDRRSPA